MTRSRLVFIGVAATLLVSGQALADGDQLADAERLFREGREAMKRKDYETACSRFALSLKRETTAGTLLNLSECEARRGHLVQALEHQHAAILNLAAEDERVALAHETARSLDSRVPRLTLRPGPSFPAEAVVVYAGSKVSRERLGTPMLVNPGRHTVSVTTPGLPEFVRTIPLVEGEHKEIVLDISSTRSSSSHADEAQSGSAADAMHAWGYVLGGAGLVGMGAGIYFVSKASQLNKQATEDQHFYKDPDYSSGYYCDQVCYDRTQDSRSMSKLGYAGLIGGGALFVGGLTLILERLSMWCDT